MSGGISQLVATGAQDVHLVGDPQVSFFRSNYKRHTNFSAVRARQVIQGTVQAGGMSTVRFEKKGDLLSYTYLTKQNGTDSISLNTDIKYVELYIGGQMVDTQYMDYSSTQWKNCEANSYAKGAEVLNNLVYPLHFFFCDNWTNALPLVALQYHDVEIRIYWDDSIATGTFECWSDFIYLDEAERTYFAETTQNMLIKQTQRHLTQSGKVQNFNFNHPVLYIGCPSAANNQLESGNDTKAELQFNINGVQSGEAMRISPHWRQVPGYYHSPDCGDNGISQPFCIPFALNLCSNQPSGSLNFSRLDSSRLEIVTSGMSFEKDETDTGGDSKSYYAVNWNVLKIENGMGGLMYSN